MAFVRFKLLGKKDHKKKYYYLVENIRSGDKINQKVLKYIGTTKPNDKELEDIKKSLKSDEIKEKVKAPTEKKTKKELGITKEKPVKKTTIEKKIEDRPISKYANINELNYKLAFEGYRNISFTPEDRAIMEQNQYVKAIDSFAVGLMGLVESKEQEDQAIKEIQKYKENYLKKKKELLGAKSNIASPMITGGANFPTRRNEKANNRENRLMGEFIEWNTKAEKKAISNVNNAFTGKLSKRELDIMKSSIDHAIEVKLKIQNNDPQFRGFNINVGSNSLQGKLLRNLDNGNIELVEQSLKYIKEKEKVLKKPVFSPRNKIFKEVELAKDRPKEAKKTGIKTLKEYKGAKIVNNFDASRIQLEFDDIPNQAIRDNLKSNGWHFSRKNEVWQRKNTSNAIFDSKNILDRHFDE